MKNIKEKAAEENDVDIAKFLLRDTVSLRNESKFTELKDMVHPLTFTYDLKKHPNVNLIPPMDKYVGMELKELFLKIYE